MQILFDPSAHEAFEYWKKYDLKRATKIKQLITNIVETPYSGIGKPEALRHSLSGLWSRRIDQEHRLVYKIEDDILRILSCRYHYDKK